MSHHEEDAAARSPDPAIHLGGGHWNVAHPLLTRAEEADLCRSAQTGCQKSSDRMVECNIRLVMSIARRYRGRSMLYEDLIQEGVIGLMEAIRRFDGDRGCKFSTYANWWVRQAITRAMDKADRMVRLPIHGRGGERKVEEAMARLEHDLGRAPTVSEIAAETGMSKTIITGLMMFGTEPTSLDLLLGDDGDLVFGEAIPDLEAIDPAASVLTGCDQDELRALIQVLPERERFVIERRFGFVDGKVWSFRELAVVMQRSRELVRNVETRALKRLREHLQEHPEVQERLWGEPRYE